MSTRSMHHHACRLDNGSGSRPMPSEVHSVLSIRTAISAPAALCHFYDKLTCSSSSVYQSDNKIIQNPGFVKSFFISFPIPISVSFIAQFLSFHAVTAGTVPFFLKSGSGLSHNFTIIRILFRRVAAVRFVEFSRVDIDVIGGFLRRTFTAG